VNIFGTARGAPAQENYGQWAKTLAKEN